MLAQIAGRLLSVPFEPRQHTKKLLQNSILFKQPPRLSSSACLDHSALPSVKTRMEHMLPPTFRSHVGIAAPLDPEPQRDARRYDTDTTEGQLEKALHSQDIRCKRHLRQQCSFLSMPKRRCEFDVLLIRPVPPPPIIRHTPAMLKELPQRVGAAGHGSLQIQPALLNKTKRADCQESLGEAPPRKLQTCRACAAGRAGIRDPR